MSDSEAAATGHAATPRSMPYRAQCFSCRGRVQAWHSSACAPAMTRQSSASCACSRLWAVSVCRWPRKASSNSARRWSAWARAKARQTAGRPRALASSFRSGRKLLRVPGCGPQSVRASTRRPRTATRPGSGRSAPAHPAAARPTVAGRRTDAGRWATPLALEVEIQCKLLLAAASDV
eukprot:scaffold3785_cov115-Isochrysis_galbana.AAC.2